MGSSFEYHCLGEQPNFDISLEVQLTDRDRHKSSLEGAATSMAGSEHFTVGWSSSFCLICYPLSCLHVRLHRQVFDADT